MNYEEDAIHRRLGVYEDWAHKNLTPEFLDIAFQNALEIGLHNQTYQEDREEAILRIYDPLVSAPMTECEYNEEQTLKIQKSLLDIYQKYGKSGINRARRCHFGYICFDFENVEHSIPDPDDELDLPFEDYKKENKSGYLFTPPISFEQRVEDIVKVESPIFSVEEPYLRAVLCSMPSLLYKEEQGEYEFISLDELKYLVTDICCRYNDVKAHDEFHKYRKAALSVWIEQDRNKLPQKQKVFQKKI